MRQFSSLGVQTGVCLWALGAVVTFAIAPHHSAIAGVPGCKAIAGGTLDVELPAGQRSTRMVQLSAGAKIKFECGGGAQGATVTLVSGQGAPRTILTAGKGPAEASFTAPDTTAYVFAIEAGGKAASSVKADCANSASANAPEPADAAPELKVAQLEGDANGLSRRSAISVGLSEFAASARAGDSPIGQWTLYSPGSGAEAVDTALAVDDEAAELSLRLSANSEINPSDLPDVLRRIERVSKLDGAADKDTQSVLTFAAISVPGLMPKEGNYRGQSEQVQQARATLASNTAGAQSPTAAQQDEADVSGWWVTHLKEEPGGLGDSTQTAVVRRDTPVVAASSAFPPPPMALGAFIPPPNAISPLVGAATH